MKINMIFHKRKYPEDSFNVNIYCWFYAKRQYHSDILDNIFSNNGQGGIFVHNIFPTSSTIIVIIAIERTH